jgi:hypothetical protein
MSFSLVTIDIDGTATPAVQAGGALYRLADVAPSVLSAPGPGGHEVSSAGGNVASSTPSVGWAQAGAPRVPCRPRQPGQWLTPLQYPRKVICTGSTTWTTSPRTAGTPRSKDDNVPSSSSNRRPPPWSARASVRYPAQSAKFDYELELAVIIGRRGRKIRADQASYVMAIQSVWTCSSETVSATPSTW